MLNAKHAMMSFLARTPLYGGHYGEHRPSLVKRGAIEGISKTTKTTAADVELSVESQTY